MKTHLTDQLILINLDLIFKSKNQCIHLNDFIDLNQRKLEDSSELVAYLIRKNLIENEEDESIFYLTTEGYDALESWNWYDPDLIPSTKSRYIPDTYSSPEEPQKKVIRPHGYIQTAIFGFLVLGGTYLINRKETKKEVPLSPTILQSIIEHQDSLKTARKPVLYKIVNGDTIAFF